MTEKENKALKYFLICLAIVIIVVVILLYFVSLGKYNLLKDEDPKAKRIKWIDKRLAALQYHAKTKEELKIKLNSKVKKWFLYTRIAIVLLYLSANTILYFFLAHGNNDWTGKFSTLMDFNQAGLILILAALFIRFENPADFRDVFKLIHLAIQGIVYRNHSGLDTEITGIYKEIEDLSKEKDGLVISEIIKTDPPKEIS